LEWEVFIEDGEQNEIKSQILCIISDKAVCHCFGRRGRVNTTLVTDLTN